MNFIFYFQVTVHHLGKSGQELIHRLSGGSSWFVQPAFSHAYAAFSWLQILVWWENFVTIEVLFFPKTLGYVKLTKAASTLT